MPFSRNIQVNSTKCINDNTFIATIPRHRIGCRQEAIGLSVHNENESGRCGDHFTKKSIEKTVRLHKHHYEIHILDESDERYASLQEDGAICHTSRDSMEVLTKFFDDRVISKGL
ncbi:uncharacterized protein TNCV_957581 [Trichonephila clavipes]|nr:uncharacterized protein TNCV_957581 [Trichonephila clavipes]